jgi:hypothetical protein
VEGGQSKPDIFIKSSLCCCRVTPRTSGWVYPINGGLEFEFRLGLRRRQRHSQTLILDEKLADKLFKTFQSALPFLLSKLRLLHLRRCGAVTDRIQRRILILLCGHDIS